MVENLRKIINSELISTESHIEVNETGKEATINKVTFNNSNFIKIDPEILSFLDNIFTKKKLCNNYALCEELSFQKKCDGLFLVKSNNNLSLCVCELKSTLNFDNFIIAKAQIEVSILKLIMILKIFNHIETFKVVCFIVSSTLDTKTAEKLKQLRARNTAKKSKAQIIYQELISDKNCMIKKEVSVLSPFPIKKEYTIENCIIHLIEGNNIKVDISRYL